MGKNLSPAAYKKRLDGINDYNKANTKSVALRFNIKTDADILDQLSKVPSKMGYIKSLIREDIERQSRG